MPAFFSGLLVLLLSCICLAPSAGAQPFETKAKQALLVDAANGAVLFAKDIDRPFAPAALAKMMTMEVVFHAIEEGRLSLGQTFKVSENAWRRGGAPSGGSTMFAKLNSEISLDDLIRGAIVQSANDACIVIAEGMAGSEEAFAQMMTERARAIGLTQSVFKNPHGLPAEGQVVTARDLVKLAEHLWRTYPEFYSYYAMPDFTWNGIFQRNRNPLLRMDIGADGLSTGATEESGFAIVGSIERQGRRLFLVLGGLASDKERADEARRILDWGMQAFEKRQIFAANEIVGEAQVYGGAKGAVPLKAGGAIAVLLPKEATEPVSARVVYQGPLEAPVVEGQQVGALKVWIGETLSQEAPLYAAAPVEQGTLSQRALGAIRELAIGWMR